jgi:hypothetical protein
MKNASEAHRNYTSVCFQPCQHLLRPASASSSNDISTFFEPRRRVDYHATTGSVTARRPEDTMNTDFRSNCEETYQETYQETNV